MQDFLLEKVIIDDKKITAVLNGLPIMEIILEGDGRVQKITSKEIIEKRDKVMINKKNNDIDVQNYIRTQQSNLRKNLKILEELELIEYIMVPDRKGSERPMQLTYLGKEIMGKKDEVTEILIREREGIYEKKNTKRTGLYHQRKHIDLVMDQIDRTIDYLRGIKARPDTRVGDLDVDLFGYFLDNIRRDFQQGDLYPHLKDHLKTYITFAELEDGLKKIDELTEKRIKKNLNEIKLLKHYLQNILNLSFSTDHTEPNSFSPHLIEWVLTGLDYHSDPVNERFYVELFENFEFTCEQLSVRNNEQVTVVKFSGAPMMTIGRFKETKYIENEYIKRVKALMKIQSTLPFISEYQDMRSVETEIDEVRRGLIMRLIEEKNRDFELDHCQFVNRQ